MSKTVLQTLIILIALGIALALLSKPKGIVEQLSSAEEPAHTLGDAERVRVSYACDQGKTIDATYTASEVAISRNKGPEVTLPQVVSGSGVRYATLDESLVFWNKGNTAFVLENNIETYSNCTDTTVIQEQVSVVPISIVEDSRCPVSVQCIQAGTLRVRAKVMPSKTEATFTLNEPVSVAGKTITLIEAGNVPRVGATHTLKDYKLQFSIK